MPSIEQLKFNIEAKNYSLRLNKVYQTQSRDFLILRFFDKGFWRASFLEYDRDTQKYLFLMIDNLETGELYSDIGKGSLQLSLNAKNYRKTWYVVNSTEEISINNLGRLTKLVQYIREKFYEV